MTAQPQGDGDSRPVHDLGTMPQDGGPFRLMTETRGPVFELCPICENTLNNCRGQLVTSACSPSSDIQFAATGQPPVQDMLVQSLQSQAVKITGETLNALRRCCLLDLCKCWPRLLTVVNVTSSGARAYLRKSWEWQEMREAVELALVYAEQPESLHWHRADALIRGYAMSAAMAIESRLDSADPNFTMLTINAGTYRAFAEGKS